MMEWIRANDIGFACSITGNGPPIVLCHGGEADHRNFANFAPILARHLTVVTFDQRDTGATFNGPVAYTLADLGKDVGKIVEALGWPKAHVLGTSFGGMVALNAAIAAPDRVDRLILINTYAAKGDGVVPVRAETLELMQSSDDNHRAEKNRLYFGSNFASSGQSVMDELLLSAMTERTAEQRARRGRTVLGDDSYHRLGQISAPTLVIHGSDDQIIAGSHAEVLAAGIPNARLEVLDGLGHAATLEDPKRVAKCVLEFVMND
jgi:3-oxoadipate enol-lactonase